MWPNSLGGTSGCSGGAGATDLGGLAASTTSASELFGPAAFGASAAGPYGALKTNPYVSALGMPPIEALHSTIGYPGCTPAGESYYCECPSYCFITCNIGGLESGTTFRMFDFISRRNGNNRLVSVCTNCCSLHIQIFTINFTRSYVSASELIK